MARTFHTPARGKAEDVTRESDQTHPAWARCPDTHSLVQATVQALETTLDFGHQVAERRDTACKVPTIQTLGH